MTDRNLEVRQDSALTIHSDDSRNISVNDCRVEAIVTDGGTLNKVYIDKEKTMNVDDFLSLSQKSYNLCVVDDECFKKNVFILPRRVCLSDGSTSELNRSKYTFVDENKKKEIYNMPCVLASEKTEAITAKIGVINNIDFLDIGICFRFLKYRTIRISVLRENMDTLGICHKKMYSELDKAHWSMKDINLLAFLMNRGLIEEIG